MRGFIMQNSMEKKVRVYVREDNPGHVALETFCGEDKYNTKFDKRCGLVIKSEKSLEIGLIIMADYYFNQLNDMKLTPRESYILITEKEICFLNKFKERMGTISGGSIFDNIEAFNTLKIPKNFFDGSAIRIEETISFQLLHIVVPFLNQPDFKRNPIIKTLYEFYDSLLGKNYFKYFLVGNNFYRIAKRKECYETTILGKIEYQQLLKELHLVDENECLTEMSIEDLSSEQLLRIKEITKDEFCNLAERQGIYVSFYPKVRIKELSEVNLSEVNLSEIYKDVFRCRMDEDEDEKLKIFEIDGLNVQKINDTFNQFREKKNDWTLLSNCLKQATHSKSIANNNNPIAQNCSALVFTLLYVGEIDKFLGSKKVWQGAQRGFCISVVSTAFIFLFDQLKGFIFPLERTLPKEPLAMFGTAITQLIAVTIVFPLTLYKKYFNSYFSFFSSSVAIGTAAGFVYSYLKSPETKNLTTPAEVRNMVEMASNSLCHKTSREDLKENASIIDGISNACTIF
jgi:hypothetical protein